MTNPVVDVIVGPSGDERDMARVGRVVAIYPASGKAGLTSWESAGLSRSRSGARVRCSTRCLTQCAKNSTSSIAPSLLGHSPSVDWSTSHRHDDVWSLTNSCGFNPCSRCVGVGSRRVPQEFDIPRDRGPRRGPGIAGVTSSTLVHRFLAGHHFALTNAQRRVLGEIAHDMASSLPMHRLLQATWVRARPSSP